MEVDLTPEGVERLRRSVAMLIRGQPALDREAAMKVMAELQRLQAGLRAVLRQVEELASPIADSCESDSDRGT